MKQNLSEYVQKRFFQEKVIHAVNSLAEKNKRSNLEEEERREIQEKIRGSRIRREPRKKEEIIK